MFCILQWTHGSSVSMSNKWRFGKISQTITVQWNYCKCFGRRSVLLNSKFICFSLQDAFIKISRNEGIGSLWSGLGPTLVLAIPATVIYFVCYEQLRVRYKEYYLKRFPGTTHCFLNPFYYSIFNRYSLFRNNSFTIFNTIVSRNVSKSFISYSSQSIRVN